MSVAGQAFPAFHLGTLSQRLQHPHAPPFSSFHSHPACSARSHRPLPGCVFLNVIYFQLRGCLFVLWTGSPPSWACPKGRELFCFDQSVDVSHFLEHSLAQHTLGERRCGTPLGCVAASLLFSAVLPSSQPPQLLTHIRSYSRVFPHSQKLSRLPGPRSALTHVPPPVCLVTSQNRVQIP